MPFAEIDGIRTRYEEVGDGPPILMYAPGGFNAHLNQWRDLGIYKRIKLLDHLPDKYRCIIFDRRENGESGGRVEAVGWQHFVRQGAGLLNHLGIDQAHLLGGCMGCPPVAAFGVAHPERVLSMTLFWPVGGAKYRINCHLRFARHLGYVEENGMQAVVDLVRSHNLNFSQDPSGGPWGNRGLARVWCGRGAGVDRVQRWSGAGVARASSEPPCDAVLLRKLHIQSITH